MSKKEDNRIFYQNGKTKISGPSRQVLFLIWFREIRTTLIVVALFIAGLVTAGKPIITIVWEWIRKLQLLILSVGVVSFLLLLSG